MVRFTVKGDKMYNLRWLTEIAQFIIVFLLENTILKSIKILVL